MKRFKHLLGGVSRADKTESPATTTVQIVENPIPQVKQIAGKRCCVYVSEDIHHKISAIARVLTNNTASVGGMVDAILKRYLEENREELNRMYNKQIERDRQCF
ncbi:DUF3408 domain-containing protein [Bacteroides thetaiotaomicron]|uniref:DUF3408 domain-containing protein n=1 Tax=Bacteroides thetaiotaomicron TaxID=818 RepID=UPI001C8C0D5A|nr:DUF3408 domain-containing protein [Bacteroides thetaiotaomicron]MBX9049622.1 DUF3408 domain-containing protein [Bacteroides thetaiotaomicron]MBX9072952.1 DUF3408 domain-containing protein [Bacteroides thetaiotaomicron]